MADDMPEPLRIDDELRAHVAACQVCTEVAEVARMMAIARADTLEQADLPSAGQIWWRATMRARAEAARAAERPILIVQALTAACAMGAIAALSAVVWPWIWQAGVRLQTLVMPETLSSFGVPLVLALGAWLVIGPIALYFVLARE